MMDAMARHGLRFREDARAALRPDPLGHLHDELVRKPGWILFGSWPRWHPVPGGEPDLHGTTLRPSVLERARAVRARTGRLDLVRLKQNEGLSYAVEAKGFLDNRRWFANDPLELTKQLAPIGQDLAAPGLSVIRRNDAASGLLYLFAND
jgi:hypothetical protein